MKKIYVLDTNVILQSAESIFKFDEHDVVISDSVLEELDSKKQLQTEIGRNARAFSRYIDEFRLKGTLTTGIQINELGGTLRVITYNDHIGLLLPNLDMNKADNRILATALSIPQTEPYQVVVVSNDTNVRIKADIYGIPAESYQTDRVAKDDFYSGIQQLVIPTILIDKIYDLGLLELNDVLPELDEEPYPNECFVFHGDCNLKQTALARYNATMKEFKLLPQDMKTMDILPRNTEQQFLLDIIKDPEISIVSVNGKAGSGKTLITLAAAMYGVLETHYYNKVVLLKPIISMDNAHDIGFLPGTMEEKLAPWMASYSDNIEVIMSGYLKEDEPYSQKSQKKSKKVTAADTKTAKTYEEKKVGKTNPMQELVELGLMEVGSLQHLRGRSLPNQIIILDEGQNITKHALKTIITRLGEGSKIIILGDISQIDSPYLDETSNGLTIVANAFKNQVIGAHITLKKSERSKLAEIASEIL